MLKQERAWPDATITQQAALRAAVRSALAQQRRTLQLSGGLMALGLAMSAAPAAAGPFPAVFELSSLDGTNGFVLNGKYGGDYSGYSVSGAGDVNGDGFEDVIIGTSPSRCCGYAESAGESYVVFGGVGAGAGGSLELDDLDGSNGFVLNGIDIDDQAGASVAGAGDVNDDGFDDLIIGAPLADPDGKSAAGESYVVFGSAGLGTGGSLDLADLDGMNGFVLNGIDGSDQSGRTVSSGGDVNGDGFDDLLIGAPNADPDGKSAAGESYVVFGGSGLGTGGSLGLADLDGMNGFVLNGIDDSDRSGRTVSSGGDVNGDGFDDLLIGASNADPDGQDRAGESYVVFGGARLGTGGSLDLADLNGMNGFVLNGIDARDYAGSSVSGTGDVNGDTVDDLIIGAQLADPDGKYAAGESYVVFGSAGLGTGGSLELADLDGMNGFVLNGIDAGDFSGGSVSGAGDVNGDQLADLIIGASQNSQADSGESYVVFGSAGLGTGGSLELADLDGMNGFVLNGIVDYDQAGSSVSGTGDVNGDGVDDLIIGAPTASPNGYSSGESYVVLGRLVDSEVVMCEDFKATMVGTSGNDVIHGTTGRDVIHGLGGDDTIHGMAGSDVICGGDDNDVVYAGGQDDKLFGGRGNDRLFGAGGRDEIRGGNGDDELFGQAGIDRLFGDAGEDRLFGGDGNDRLFGGLDRDRLFGQAGNDTLNGGDASDRCNGGAGNGDTATSCEQSTNVP